MRRTLLLAALAVVLVATAWPVISAVRNQAAAPGGTVELTERELPLVSMAADSTVTLLQLRWDTLPRDPSRRRAPDWLDRAKLEDLGFDCRVPATSPHARAHYAAMGPVPVYVVLEYMGEARGRAGNEDRAGTRLFAVDAGKDPAALRRNYPDQAAFLIVYGLIRPYVREDKPQNPSASAVPVLCGRIDQILPETVFVPMPYAGVLRGFRGRDLDTSDDREEHRPRYAVGISWGVAYQPWVRDVRLLPPAEPSRPAQP